MPRIGLRRNTKYKAKGRRRRASTITKARYQAPTARNQKKQILSNAFAIRMLNRLRPPTIYCDWQFQGTEFATVDPAGDFTITKGLVPLTDFGSWNPVMRIDDNVQDSSTTMITRIMINMRYTLQSASYSFMSIFVVTLRKDSANLVPTAAALIPRIHYIENTLDGNVRLNPAVFKVHFARYVTLTCNNLLSAPFNAASPTRLAGNPYSTWKKGQITLKMRAKIRNPVGEKWTGLTPVDLPRSQRFYMLTFQTSQGNTTETNTWSRVDYDVLCTTINN